MEIAGEVRHRGHPDPGGKLRFVPSQPVQLHRQGGGQGCREGGQRHTGRRLPPGQDDRTMECHDGLAGPGRTGNAHRAVVAALHQPTLGRVQEHGPAVPGRIQRPLQLLHIVQDAEAALGVRVVEGIAPLVALPTRCGRARQDAGGAVFQQRLHRLFRQIVGKVENRVHRRLVDLRDPVRRYTDRQQVILRQVEKQGQQERRLGFPAGADRRVVAQRRGFPGFHAGEGMMDRRTAFRLHPFDQADDLRRPGDGMTFDPPPRCPGIGVIMVIDVAEQQARLGAMDDQPDIGVHPHRPEIPVFRPFQPMKAQPRRGWVKLQVERGVLHRFLHRPRQPRQRVGEGVGDAEVHGMRSPFRDFGANISDDQRCRCSDRPCEVHAHDACANLSMPWTEY